MIIRLKQKHINQGERNSPCNCALAKAFKDALGIDPEADGGDEQYVEVDGDIVTVYHHQDVVHRFITPAKAAKLIEKFDDFGKKAVKPGMFEFLPEGQ